MESADQLYRLFTYDMWANEQVLLTIQQNLPFKNSEKCITYFAHISGAQELWYKRIMGESTDELEVWPDYDLPIALQKLKTLSGNWKRLIENSRDKGNFEISYKNSKGTSYQTPFADILHHVVIHGQHHRAQIAQLLRIAKVTPPATDFIYFSRAN